METIERKRMLYKTRVDYQIGTDGKPINDYAMNHVLGCVHGCKYPCYAMGAAMRFKQVGSEDDWRCPKVVSNTLELLERELATKKDVRRVHMCFTTDPLPFIPAGTDAGLNATLERINESTLECIDYLNWSGIPVTVLTKGLLPVVDKYYQDTGNLKEAGKLPMLLKTPFDLHAPGVCYPLEDNYYGISLVSLDEGFREMWEPGAAPYSWRLAHLMHLHDAGCKTWVSMEPYPALKWNMGEVTAGPLASRMDDYAGLRHLLEQVSFVDRIVFGRWNYNDAAPCDVTDPDAWYRDAACIVKDFCEAHGIECIIKKGTVRDV